MPTKCLLFVLKESFADDDNLTPVDLNLDFDGQ